MHTPKQLDAFTNRVQAEYADTEESNAYHLLLFKPLRDDLPCSAGMCPECAVSLVGDEEDSELSPFCQLHINWILRAWPVCTSDSEESGTIALGWLVGNPNAVDWLLP